MENLELPLGKRTRFYRFFERLPLSLSVLYVLAPVLLSLIDPLYGAIFVIVFLIIWFVKAFAMSARSIQGYNILQRSQKVDWKKRLNDLADPEFALKKCGRRGWKMSVHKRNLELLALRDSRKKPSDVYNAIIIATYNESREVLEPTILSVLASNYDMKQVILVIAYEERGGPEVEKTVKALKGKYGSKFGDFYIVKHPAGMANEVIGKGANITYAGKKLADFIEKKGIASDNVIVTTLDSDNRPHAEYLAYLTYEYIVHPEPRYSSFQPLSLYLNNIWDVPAPMRVLATGNSFWNIVISQRPHMLRNFASHSQGLTPLLDMDFWSTRTIVEDGHQFWRSYFCYKGQYSVVPVYVPIYQDAVMSDKYVRTLKAQFIQLRRWAYGASDVPFVASQIFTKKRTVPFADGFIKFMQLLDSHVTWASAPYILMFGAFAPLFLSSEASRSIVAHQLPSVASMVQQIAMVGLFITIVLSLRMLPERPKRYTRWRSLGMLLQWVLAPFMAIIYGSSAAFNAQYHLFFGKYLTTFDVTEKTVVPKDGTKKHRKNTSA